MNSKSPKTKTKKDNRNILVILILCASMMYI